MAVEASIMQRHPTIIVLTRDRCPAEDTSLQQGQIAGYSCTVKAVSAVDVVKLLHIDEARVDQQVKNVVGSIFGNTEKNSCCSPLAHRRRLQTAQPSSYLCFVSKDGRLKYLGVKINVIGLHRLIRHVFIYRRNGVLYLLSFSPRAKI